MDRLSPYGGRNDRALCLVQECMLEEAFIMRALKDTGEICVSLLCNDVFAWACADAEELPDAEWTEFEKSLERARDQFDWGSREMQWFPSAWAVKLRGIAPQKPATDRYPEFVRMLDFLEVPWREMKRYDQMDPVTLRELADTVEAGKSVSPASEPRNNPEDQATLERLAKWVAGADNPDDPSPVKGSWISELLKITYVDRTSASEPDTSEQHPDDQAVDRFAAAMKAKLAKARAKGRSGWDDPDKCATSYLVELLYGHLQKDNPGNFEDVANLCMMLHQRGAHPKELSEGAALLRTPSDTPIYNPVRLEEG